MAAIAELITIRKATEDDDPFLLETIRAARMSDPQFVRCTDEQQRAIVHFERDIRAQTLAAVYPQATTSVILIGGQTAGRLIVDRSVAAIRLIDIELLPDFRGRGAGTEIVRSLCDEASAADVPVTLRVDVANTAARRLYQRLGFRVVEFDWSFIEMAWTPSA